MLCAYGTLTTESISEMLNTLATTVGIISLVLVLMWVLKGAFYIVAKTEIKGIGEVLAVFTALACIFIIVTSSASSNTPSHTAFSILAFVIFNALCVYVTCVIRYPLFRGLVISKTTCTGISFAYVLAFFSFIAVGASFDAESVLRLGLDPKLREMFMLTAPILTVITWSSLMNLDNPDKVYQDEEEDSE